MTDVHELARELAREAARFRALFDATTDLVWRTDAHGRLVDGERWAAVTGRPNAHALGDGWREDVHPDDLEGLFGEWRAALRARRPYNAIVRLHTGADRYRRFRVQGVPILDPDGRVAEWVGITRDVEESLAAEDVMRASQARYRSLVEATSQMVWRTTADGREADGHEAWSAFTGVPVTAESTSEEWFRPVYPDDRAGLARAWRAALAGGRAYEHPYRVRAADGTWRSMVVRAVPVRDARGVLVEWVGTHTDVTEREASREARERERALLAEAQRIGRVGSWSWDLVTGEILLSDEVYHMFGVSPHELRAYGANAVEAFYALLDPAERARAADQQRAVVEARHPSSSGQWRVRRPDGHEIVVVTRSEWHYDAAGRLVLSSGMVQDVTNLAAADAALRASEERFRLAARATRDVIYEYDIATGAVWTSDGMSAAFRKAAGTASDASTWAERLHPDDRARVGATLGAVLAGGGDTFTAEYRFRRGDGTWANVIDRAHVARDPDGRPRRLVGAIADVSEQRELEAQLRQAQKMEAVGQLAGGVAHDFNNLLSVILASSELSRNAAPPGSVLAADLDEIARAARRGAQLTRQLLAFSRRQVLRPRLLDLVDVVRGAEPLLRRLLPETVVLELAVPAAAGAHCAVHADPGQIEQVLMNLVVNARDAVAAAGSVAVGSADAGSEVGPTGLVQVAVDLMTDDEAAAAGLPPSARYVALRVRDDGIGMDAATRARVFEPFFTTKGPGQGTGLGLSTVYGIAAQSGGTMLVESTVGGGATFTLLLPAAPGGCADTDAPSTPAPAAEPSVPAPSAGTVLLVEDEAAVRRMTRRLLERRGYRVLEARHGADALLVWEEHEGEVDVVLTDLRMPEMGGYDLITRLRARKPGLPAVVMSGYVTELEGGGVRAIDKPFTPEEMLGAVEEVIRATPPSPL